MSPIAYADSDDEAMAYRSFECGLLCAQGLAVVLQRIDGRWIIVEHLILWES